MIWSSNPDLVSNVQVDSFPEITDHRVITATTSYKLKSEADKEKNFLLESCIRFHKLDIAKAPWTSIQTRLGEIEWAPMKIMAKEDVTDAHSNFIETLDKRRRYMEKARKDKEQATVNVFSLQRNFPPTVKSQT